MSYLFELRHGPLQILALRSRFVWLINLQVLLNLFLVFEKRVDMGKVFRCARNDFGFFPQSTGATGPLLCPVLWKIFYQLLGSNLFCKNRPLFWPTLLVLGSSK